MQIRGVVSEEFSPSKAKVWQKKLSRTDAQQPTKGWGFSCLRFTKAGLDINVKTFFRQNMFKGLVWRKGVVDKSKNVVDYVLIEVAVIIMGEYKGIREMIVSHDPSRMKANAHPATRLHYDDSTQQELAKQDLTGKNVRFQRGEDSTFLLVIEDVFSIGE